MAQKTALSVLGTPGQTQAFSAKSVASSVEFILVDDVITFAGDNLPIVFDEDNQVITFAGDNQVILMR